MEGTIRGAIKRVFRQISRRSLDLSSISSYLMSLNRVQRLTDFSQSERPVLLIHGWATARRVMAILETRLRKDGFDVFSFRLGGMLDTFNTGGLVTAAKLVDRKVERLSARYDLPKVDVVAHSAGGLVARYWIKRLAGHRHVRNLVCLATPHHGTRLAYLGIATVGLLSRSVWQLAPMSRFIRTLNVGDFPQETRLINIYSPADKICPDPTCVLEAREAHVTNIAVEGYAHTDFLKRKGVYQIIRRELRGEHEYPEYAEDAPTVQDREPVDG